MKDNMIPVGSSFDFSEESTRKLFFFVEEKG